MEVKYINPFIESIDEIFTTMFDAKVSHGNVGVAKGPTQMNSVTALIGLSGAIRGTVALCLPEKTALAIVNRLLGTESETIDDMITDGIGEVVNIIAGSAKAIIAKNGSPIIELGLPTVVTGANYSVVYPLEGRMG